MTQVRHNCGLALAPTLNDVYKMGAGIQHRGREATGLFAMRREAPHVIDCIKWLGPIERFSISALKELLPKEDYKYFGLHTRYATRGRKDSLLADAHPHTIGGQKFSYDDFEIIHGATKVIMHNGQVNLGELKDIDKDLLRFGCDSEALLNYYDRFGIEEVYKNIPGAYTLIIADSTKNEVLVGRDKLAMKPGVIGEKNGIVFVASENTALQEVGAFTKETLTPGKIYIFNGDNNYKKKRLVETSRRQMCFFEANYIMARESNFQHCHVNTLRGKLGVALSEEFSSLKENNDLVTFIPNCPAFAANRFASKLRMELLNIFVKPKKTRAFQGSTEEERAKSIKSNLVIPPHIQKEIKGKNIIVIDDSFVRGNNSKYAVKLLQDAGVNKITLLSYTPIIGQISKDGTLHGCSYGVDMPPSDNFLAREQNKNRTNQEMAQAIGADEIHFLSKEKMLDVFEQVGLIKENLCTHCIGGEKPF